MTEHISTERMNECLDGLVADAELRAVEEHLDGCAACRNEYARLAEVVRTIGALPRDATAPDGAWEAIVARIGEGVSDRVEDEATVYRFPTDRRGARRLSFSVPQAAAAGMAVALVSAGLMWMAIGGGGSDAIPSSAEVDGPGGAAARAVSLDAGRYEAVVGELEQILAQGRSVLTPETLASIDESLATIDAAIAEIETALATDPASGLLRRMLADRQRTRLGVLQRAAAAVQAQI